MQSEVEHGVARWPAYFAQRYRESGAWTDETVSDLLERSAERRPSALAAVGADWHMTYAELTDGAARFAAALLELGLRSGDRVLLQLANAPETLVAYYGTIRAGLIPVCSIAAHGEHDMRRLAAQTRARAHIVQGDYAGQDLPALAARVRAGSEHLEHVIVTGGPEFTRFTAADARERLRDVHAAPDDVAVFQLSGGTTGTPKVIPRVHCEYVYNARRWAEVCGWDAETRVMHIVPLIHNAGISASMQPCHAVGGRLVLPARSRPEDIFELIERERVQVLPLVPPALLIRMVEHPERDRYDLSSLEQMFVGGQRLAPETADAAERAFGIPCNQKFGMAEGMFFRTPDDAPAWVRRHTVGAPIAPLDEVRVLAPGREDPVALGEVGELCCRGPYTIRGYFEAPEHNARAFTSDGFYRTGDLARAHSIDGAVYYSIEGRIKDVINRGAEKISAAEIEELIGLHAAVRTVAVVAMPDRELGERACAFVVADPDAAELSLQALVDHLLAAGLAKFKLPERLELIDALPETNIKKVDKKALRERIAAQLEAEAAFTQPSKI